jgi:hypothetical protein
VSIDWGWLAVMYAGWRIEGLRAIGSRDRQELMLTLVRRRGGRARGAGAPGAAARHDPAEWDGFDEALAAWRRRDG